MSKLFRQLYERLAIRILGFVVCCYLIGRAYDFVRPALPFVITVLLLAVLLRLLLNWRRRY